MESLRVMGERLRAQRLTLKMSAEEAAREAGVSRALLHRYEAGQIVKLDVMERLASVYRISTTSLLGLGTEYVTDGFRFFERVTKLEESAEQMTVVFGPLVYVLCSGQYDQVLGRSLQDQGAIEPLTSAECSRLMAVLTQRKKTFEARQPHCINILPLSNIENYLAHGLNALQSHSYADRMARRKDALREIAHTAELLESPPMHVQIALTNRPLPTAGYQIIRSKERRLLVNSPFRLGEPLNLRYGVATITEDEEALKKHDDLTQILWQSALKGAEAATALRKMLKKYRD